MDEPLPTLEVGATRIHQVLQNLIDNAVKFIDKPQGEIGIGSEQDGAMRRFHVSDNDPGIAPKHFERIVEMYGAKYGWSQRWQPVKLFTSPCPTIL